MRYKSIALKIDCSLRLRKRVSACHGGQLLSSACHYCLLPTLSHGTLIFEDKAECESGVANLHVGVSGLMLDCSSWLETTHDRHEVEYQNCMVILKH